MTSRNFLTLSISLLLILIAGCIPIEDCLDMDEPYTTLGTTIAYSEGNSGFLKSICHKTVKSNTHYKKERLDLATYELIKIINVLQKASSKIVDGDSRTAITYEANKLIDSLSGEKLPIFGLVYEEFNGTLVEGATIEITFINNEHSSMTTSDADGFFYFNEAPNEGGYIIVASTDEGMSGTVFSSSLSNNSSKGIEVPISSIGESVIEGQVSDSQNIGVASWVHLKFTKTGRMFSTTSDDSGYFTLSGLPNDGSAFLIAQEKDGTATGTQTVSLYSKTYAYADISLNAPQEVNNELVNGSFSQGTEGWKTIGDIKIVDRDSVFSSKGE